MFEKDTIRILEKALAKLEEGFEALPDFQQSYDLERIEELTMQVAEIMQNNYPYFHPYYAGQMLKPPHPIARVAYMLSLWINPNNHALDGGRASSALEKEAVAEIANLFQWDRFLGHLTGGGTMANLEALWISGQLRPGLKVLASEQAHYTHKRISDVLGLKFQSIPCDEKAKMDVHALRKMLESGDVGTVVATIGTTGTGSVDPLSEILGLKEAYGFHLHADAAYGGYFILTDNLFPETRVAYESLKEVDSIVIDPHKHGLQPYGCGCILYRDPEVGKHYKHDSPYTYFTSSELHLGEISLECSRAGASAVALWATQKLMPLVRGGEFALGLSKGREAALAIYERIVVDKRFRTIFPPELDILVWAPAGESASEISERSEAFFQKASEENLHLATFKYPSSSLQTLWGDVDFDHPHVLCLRSCLMKPEHDEWLERIWQVLDRVVNLVLS
ncbi:MAG: pyridoxal-dependent decarboxylase [Chloroflexi bacterium RBG_16_48_8]|nr:MAG: pyridoxal-dependent decarboxylase [Chloroflexi bacterium RBG_16_48_8]